MFKRQIKVDLVKEEKKKKVEFVENPGPSFEEKAVLIGRLMERSIKKLTIAAVVLILADTVRRVATEQASQPPVE